MLKFIKELILKLRKIFGHFHRSSVSQTTLEKEQMKYQLPKNKLIQDCITKWNLTHDMILSVLKNLNPINNTLIMNLKTDNWRITLQESKKMEDLVVVLDPFKTATEIHGGDKYVTSSITGRVFKSLITSLETKQTDSAFIKAIKSAIYCDLKHINNEITSVVLKTAALDPRYTSLKFLTDKKKLKYGKNWNNK